MSMENFPAITKPDHTELELPPGFRFHPTDEELITHYLSPKVIDNGFSAIAIGEVDLNKVEPWELPWRAKMGEKEWYFFCMRDRKYPTGARTNRASEAGYWKGTGKDKEIFRVKKLVGMKKTLVFYKGRAPKGEKTNWVMHEYRLEGKNCVSTQSTKAAKNERVICRIFKKSSGGKKVHISGLRRTSNDCDDDSETSNLPALMDLSSDDQKPKGITAADSSHVTCLSSFLEEQKPFDSLIIPDLAASSSRTSDFSQFSFHFPKISPQKVVFSSQFMPTYTENSPHSDSSFLQEQSILRLLLEQSDGQGGRQNAKLEVSGDTEIPSPSLSNHEADLRPYGYGDQEFPIFITGPADLDCLWNL